MKFSNKLKAFFALVVISFVTVSCEEDLPGNPILGTDYISFEPNKTANLSSGELGEVDVKVFISQPKDFDRTISLLVDIDGNSSTVGSDGDFGSTLSPDNFSVPASVTIPAGATEAVFQITNILPEGNDKTIVIDFVRQEGDDDIHIASTYASLTTLEGVSYTTLVRDFTLKVNEVCNNNPLRIEIVTDRYGEETSWELYDSTMTQIASGGPYERLSANGTFAQPHVNLCLVDGSYTFIVLDSYGDGMDSGAGNGYYRLVKIVDGVEVEIAKNGVFGAFEEVMFTLP